MAFIYNDGGRSEAGYKGKAGDCLARSISIASGRPYQEVYDGINAASAIEKRGKRWRRGSSAREGVYTKTARAYIASLDGVWTATMMVGAGCRVHLRAEELPRGRIVARVSHHFVAVIDGDIHDNHDPSRGGTRCVYGYWSFPSSEDR